MSTLEPPLPTFLIIGAQKSATRWLRVNLGAHPEIYTAPRELHFWNLAERVNAQNGLEWYRGKFTGWNGEPVVGEATPGYMIWRHRPPKIAFRLGARIPDMRLIAILRNPIDRAQSAMNHHMRRNRLPPGSRLVDLLYERQPAERDRLCLVSGGWYWRSLLPYRNAFRENLLVLRYDDIATAPEQVYEQAVRHVGATHGFMPRQLRRVVFSNRRARSSSRHELTPDDRLALWPFFRDDVALLEHDFGLDLSSWKPEGGDDVPANGCRVPEISPWMLALRANHPRAPRAEAAPTPPDARAPHPEPSL
jgi:hypothetical protein